VLSLQIEIIQRLARDGVTNVGIVYNLHHGHEHLDRFPELLVKMKPYLLALNLNGTKHGGDQAGEKILVLGQGTEDLRLLRLIRESGWQGPIGILNHTEEDAETRLKANLEGWRNCVHSLAHYDQVEKDDGGSDREMAMPGKVTLELSRADGIELTCVQLSPRAHWHALHRDYRTLGGSGRSS
jgi:hypothetical protein